jgi:3-hydroxymyristoyl/3-hydroxydecanoyl-(acyl carrier protein) dehydratase/1-acyl-sn-glycerol-3-phosphate acyltransferase
MRVGSTVDCEYDVRPDDWYFDGSGARAMPFSVLLEAALQPCGWLASYVGSALTFDTDVAFRNLDGTGRVLAELPQAVSTLRTRASITNISRAAGMLIESFEVTCLAGEVPVFELKTVFGFFPEAALANQKGLPWPEAEADVLTAPSEESVALGERPERYFGSGPRLASSRLLMLDRVTGVWTDGGAAGRGRFRAEIDVDPGAWFFKAHFFQDPVQPGSLGVEAMLQLLRFAMIRLGLCDGPFAGGRFEPVATGAPVSWKYRGQVSPQNRIVTVLLDVVGSAEDEEGRLATADASLFVDGKRIYEAKGLAMRIVRPAAPTEAVVAGDGAVTDRDTELLDPEQARWLGDHRPTWTVPALPLMSMVDRLAAAAARRAPGFKVVGIEDARVHRWLPVAAPVRLTTSVDEVMPSPGEPGKASGERRFDVTLSAWRDAPTAALSRFEPVATARVVLAPELAPADEAPWEPPVEAQPAPDPYASGLLFHGPSFQLLRSLRIGAGGSSALLDAAGGGPGRGLLHEALLDALTHGIAHDRLSIWSPEIPPDRVAYPQRITFLRFHADPPRTGEVRCETRFAGFDGDLRFPRFRVQASAAGRVFATFELVEVLFPKGPLGCLSPSDRRAFLRDRVYVRGARLSRDDGESSTLSDAALRESDWLPGTVGQAYGVEGDLLTGVAVKEHVAARVQVHPATVRWDPSARLATAGSEPLNPLPLAVARTGDTVTVRDAGPARLDLGPVRDYWDRYFGIGRWPVEDLYYGLAGRFVRRVRLEDAEAFASVRERSVLYLANHQVAVESLLFSVIVSGLTRVPTVTLAKAEHRDSWLGRLIQHAFAYPGARDPGVITYFDRADRGDLPRIIGRLGDELRSGAKSVLVHVEGTRSLACGGPPVSKLSGTFLDMAIASGVPVVPVRFVGGLPAEPGATRLEFPWMLGQQDLWLGRPIAPGTLAALPYKERKELVVGAINALGPPHSDEQPLPGDPALLGAASAWAERTGASAEHAVILETLRRMPAPGAELSQLLAGAAAGLLEVEDDVRGRWLAELAARLLGPRGPSVSVRRQRRG